MHFLNKLFTGCSLLFFSAFSFGAQFHPSAADVKHKNDSNFYLQQNMMGPTPTAQPHFGSYKMSLPEGKTFSFGGNYQNIPGSYFNAQYGQKLSERIAFSALGEYGQNTYRAGGTVGISLFQHGFLKFSAEQLSQVLPFNFLFMNNVEERVGQSAYGLRYQHDIGSGLLRNVNAGGYFARAESFWLNPVFIPNGFCPFAAGSMCIDYRHIAGADSKGGDVGVELAVAPRTRVLGNVFYDDIDYKTVFQPRSPYNKQGVGGVIKMDQILASRLKGSGIVELRKVYDTYTLLFSWLPPSSLNCELSLMAQRLVSHNQTPNSYKVGLQLNLALEGGEPGGYDFASKQQTDLSDFVNTPAAYMQRVLAVSEELVQVITPQSTAAVTKLQLISISPNSNLGLGDLITFTGQGFVSGSTITYKNTGEGGSAGNTYQAIDVTFVNSTTLTATIAGINTGTDFGFFNVTVTNPDGQSATIANGINVP